MPASSPPSQHYQFSLRTLLVLMLVAAIAVSRVQVPQASWDNHALALFAFLFLVGLLCQAWDLWTTHRQHTWQSPRDRDGWLFAIGWRVGLSLWILAVLALDYLDAYRVISLPETEDAFNETGRMTREALLRLTLLVALAGASQHKILAQVPSVRSSCFNGLGWLALLVICFLFCLDASLLPMIVHVALRGIEATRPWLVFGVFRNTDAWVDLTDATQRFFDRAAISTALIPVNLALTAALAWQWRRGFVRRILIAVPLAAGLAFTTRFTIWASQDGFASISPGLAPFIVVDPVYRWVLWGLLIGLASAAAGAQFVYRANCWKPVTQVPWDRHPRTYLHQRTTVLLALLAICAAHNIGAIAIEWWNGQINILSVTELFYWLYSNTTALLELAIVMVVIRVLWTKRRRAAGNYSTGPFALSLPAWSTVSVALFVTMASGLPTLYWLAFAIWLQSGRV